MIVIHFPIALLMIAPLFVVIGGLTGLRSMMASALILMLLGVAGAFAATNTGEAALDYMEIDTGDLDKDDLGYEVADQHEYNGELARNLFAACTLVYAIFVGLILASKKCAAVGPRIVMHLVLLGLWVYPTIVLANAAHEGGRLVHEFGVKSILAETAEPAPEGEDEAEEEEESDADSDEAA